MKKRTRNSIPAIFLLFIASLIQGCNTTGCTDNRSSLLIAGFYSMSSQKAIALESVEIGGIDAPNDSLLVDSKNSASDVYLPLRHTLPSSSFFIRYLGDEIAQYNVADTITIDYTSEPFFASEECGAIYRYHITALSHTHNLIDSIGLLDSIINNSDMQKMRIFFHTSEALTPQRHGDF